VEVEDPMEAVAPTTMVDLTVIVDLLEQVVLILMEEVDPMDLVGLIHHMEVYLAHPLETVVGATISQEVPPTLT